MSSNKSCEFNNYINIILLIMFVIVVLVSLGYKSCSSSRKLNKAGSDIDIHQSVIHNQIDSTNLSLNLENGKEF